MFEKDYKLNNFKCLQSENIHNSDDYIGVSGWLKII